jgi:hypothetical protein
MVQVLQAAAEAEPTKPVVQIQMVSVVMVQLIL